MLAADRLNSEETMKVQLIAWGAEMTPEFAEALCGVAHRIGCDASDLAACMKFESGISPHVRNAVSGATGLIQFMPSTAKRLGTTTADLAEMSGVEQLEYVEKYFQPFVGTLKTIDDLYMAILWPAAVGKDDHYILFSQGSKAYEQNVGLDGDRKGYVTKRDAAAVPRALLAKGWLHASS